jgi:predicted aspartyl protease
LGLMYAYGRGVQRDYVRAYMWLTLGLNARARMDRRGAQCQGNCDDDNLAQVTAELTATEIERAQEMAKLCAKSNYRRCGETTSVPMQLEGGTYVVPVLINDAITLNFLVDSGAADVSIPADVVMTLMRTGTLTEADFLGQQIYELADGSKVPSQTFRIRSLKVGNTVLEDVNGSVASVRGGLC